MNVGTAILCVVTALAGAKVEQNGVRVDVSIESQIYRWEVTNVDAPLITRFEIQAHNIYNELAPEGWESELRPGAFHAWTRQDHHAIRRGRSMTFQCRVTSSGASLGLVPLTIGFHDGNDVNFDAVWGPVPKPRSLIVVIPALIVVLALLHTAWLVRRHRRGRPGVTRAP